MFLGFYNNRHSFIPLGNRTGGVYMSINTCSPKPNKVVVYDPSSKSYISLSAHICPKGSCNSPFQGKRGVTRFGV